MKKNRKQNVRLYDKIKLIPVYFVIAIIPLIVKEHYYKSNLEQLPWYASDGNFDLFLYWKSIAIICTGICMIPVLCFGDMKKDRKIPAAFIPLIFYELFAILSSVLSQNSFYSFYGIRDQFESIWVLLAYGIIAYYTYKVIIQENDLNKVIKWVTIGVIGVLFIGLSQFAGVDFYKFLFRNRDYSFNFESGRVYGPFYNPNYVGTYISLLFPLFLSIFIYKKNLKSRFFSGIIIIGMFLILIGSKSTTGFIITTVTAIIILLFYRERWLKHKKTVIAVLVLFCIILFAARGFINENVINKIKGSFQKEAHTERKVERIETNDNNVTIKYMGNNLYIDFIVVDEEFGEFTFYITDEDNQGIASNIDHDTGVITLTDERFSGITLSAVYISDMNNLLAFLINIDGGTWYFTNQTDGSYYYITNAAKLDKINEYPSAIFTGIPSFASGRGYIWSKTIPLLKDTLVLGTGADTFMLAYPNDDYVENYYNGMENIYVTRPHNMYLQMGVQTGILSVFAFLCFYLIYAVMSIKLFWKNEYTTYESNVGLGIFVGTTAYMIVGMINDSTVTVSPIYWCLMGIGIGINMRMSRKL